METITKTFNVYSFDELTEDIQEKIIEKEYDINISYDWWEFTYMDAEDINIKLTGFDLDRANYCHGHLTSSALDSINKVLVNHGESCKTYKIAKNYKKDLEELYTKLEQNEDDDSYYDIESEIDDLESEYLTDMLHEYKTILSKEYDYLTSGESIKETINANDYKFTEDGEIYN